MATVNSEPGFTQFEKVNILDKLLIKGQSVVSQTFKSVFVANSENSQSPVALDTPLQVEFGPALNDVNDPAMIDALGNVTINEDGIYVLTALFSISRSTSAGRAYLFFRYLINGVQIGNPVAVIASDDEMTIPLSFTRITNLAAGNVLTVEFVRDSLGIFNGSLFSYTSSIGWGDSSSAILRIEKF